MKPWRIWVTPVVEESYETMKDLVTPVAEESVKSMKDWVSPVAEESCETMIGLLLWWKRPVKPRRIWVFPVEEVSIYLATIYLVNHAPHDR